MLEGTGLEQSQESDDKKEKDPEDENKEERSETVGQVEKNEEDKEENETKEVEGCHIETMVAYVNDSEVVVEQTNEVKTVESMLFEGETESEKEERMAVIGQSLVISRLEDDLEQILKTKIAVKESKECICHLKQVIELLEGFEIKMKQDTEKSGETSEERNVEVKDTGEEISGSEVIDSKKDKEEDLPVNGNGDDGECEKNYTVEGDLDEINKVKEKGKEDNVIEEQEEIGKENNATEMGKEYVKSEEMSTNKGVIFLDKSKVDKSVLFEIEADDQTEICIGKIQVKVADMFNTVATLQEDDTKQRIDEEYEKFLSSQSKCDEYIEDMKKKQIEEEADIEETLPYCVQTEDIMDDEKNEESASEITNKDDIQSEIEENKNSEEIPKIPEEDTHEQEKNKDIKDEEDRKPMVIESEKTSEIEEEKICKIDEEWVMSEQKNADKGIEGCSGDEVSKQEEVKERTDTSGSKNLKVEEKEEKDDNIRKIDDEEQTDKVDDSADLVYIERYFEMLLILLG